MYPYYVCATRLTEGEFYLRQILFLEHVEQIVYEVFYRTYNGICEISPDGTILFDVTPPLTHFRLRYVSDGMTLAEISRFAPHTIEEELEGDWKAETVRIINSYKHNLCSALAHASLPKRYMGMHVIPDATLADIRFRFNDAGEERSTFFS